ncbi:MAG: mechanosensitive ion channel family protein [Blastocatellia bacterium]|nr:mechanosensitive ion channel family protein [Blastocatellia bacterium]
MQDPIFFLSRPGLLFLRLETQVEFLTTFTLENIVLAILVVVVTALAVYLSDRLLEGLAKKAPRARFYFKLLAPVLRFTSWTVGFVIVMTIFSPSRDTLLALMASVGIALGLGAQDLVKNIIGGLVILADRPYQLGDRVKIGDAYGEIDHIGLRSTKLTTADDTRVTIPNSEILSGKAWNANSGVPDCQVVTDLFVPHDVNPTEAVEIGYEAAYSSPFLLLAKPVVVLLQDRFQDGPFMLVRIKAYVFDHRFEPRLQSDITIRAKAEFLRRGMLLRWGRHDPGPSTKALRTGNES